MIWSPHVLRRHARKRPRSVRHAVLPDAFAKQQHEVLCQVSQARARLGVQTRERILGGLLIFIGVYFPRYVSVAICISLSVLSARA